MSLLCPTTGEIVDRLTILTLKIGFAKDRELVKRLEEERDELFRELNLIRWPFETFHLVINEWSRLAAVNARIFQREDEIRKDLDLRSWTTQPLNDERARLVKKIDELLGVKRTSEKLWMERGEEESQ
jgi:hypothetical protein